MDSDSLTAVPEVGVWQLRRIGPRPTVQNSACLIRLREDGEVTIGRGPAADYFLDSAVTLRLISRIHATIRGDRVPGGHPRFTIVNNGLNGTYINDLKMRCYPDNQQVLLEGDKITFGHPGCASIQPGAYAPQHDSEFQFIFECVPASRAAAVDRYCSHSKVVPLNGNPRHSHQQKQGIVVTTGNPGTLLTDSPQSNTSTSEKENEVGSSHYRDVKSTSLSNGCYARSFSKHHLGAEESFQPDSKQTKLAKFGHKNAHILCMEKKLNGNGIDNISHVSSFAAQHGHSNGKLNYAITSTVVSCSSPNKVDKMVDAQKGMKNVDLPSSIVPDKLPSVSPAYPSSLSPLSLATSHDKPCNSLRREIEVHSTMIILGDEVEDDSSDDSNDCDSDFVGDSEIEFVTATGPILPVRKNIKMENEVSDMISTDSEEIDVVNGDNEDLNLDLEIAENDRVDLKNVENDRVDLKNVENDRVGFKKVENDRLRLDSVENKNKHTINDDNEDSDVVSDESDEVINDSDNNMPSLVRMKENVDNLEMLENEESMPRLLLITDLPQVSTNSHNNTGVLKTSTALLGSRDNRQINIKNNESRIKNMHKVSSSLSESLSNNETYTLPTSVVPSYGLSKHCTKSPRLEQIFSAVTSENKFNKTVLEFSKRNFQKKPDLETKGERCAAELTSESSKDNDITECGEKSTYKQTSKLINIEPKPNSSCNHSGAFSNVPSVKSPGIYPSGSIQDISLKLSKTVKDNLSLVSHSKICNEKATKSSYDSELTSRKSPSSNSVQALSPLSYLPLSPVSALLPPKVTSHRCGSPISNITTIILSSGNELRDMSSRSGRKSSVRSKRHRNHHHNQSSPSSSSSRSTSRSSNHSVSSDESLLNSESSSESSHPKSRPSSQSSHPKSRPSSQSSHPKSRPSSQSSHPKSRPSPQSSYPKSRLCSLSSLPNSRPSSEASRSKSRPSSEVSQSSSSSEASHPQSRLPLEASRPQSRSSSETSHPQSGSSLEASHPQSRSSSEDSHPQSKSFSEISHSHPKSKSSSEVSHPASKSSLDFSNFLSRPPSETSKSSSDVPLSKLKQSLDVPLSKLKQSLDVPLQNSRRSSSTSPSSKSSEYLSQNSSALSHSTPKKFFKDTVPNMYSSSDEDNTLQESKTEIVKKIYSSARGKQEKDVDRVEVSRRSALFKGHKISASGNSHQSPAAPSLSSKPSTTASKPVVPGCDPMKGPKKVDRDPSPASSSLSSDLSDIEGIEKKILRTAAQENLEKKTEIKPSELPPTPVKAKPSINKQPLLPSSPSLSLTSLPWLTDISVPCNPIKKSKVKQTLRKAGLLPRTSPLLFSKTGNNSLHQTRQEGTNLTHSSFAASKVAPPASKASNDLSFQRAEIKSQKVSVPKPKGSMQTGVSGLKNKVETSLIPKPTVKADITDVLKGKDPTSVSVKGNIAGAANGLKRSHNNDKPLDTKSRARNICEKKASRRHGPGGSSGSQNKNSKLEEDATDSDEPASKKKDSKQLSSETSATPSRRNPRTRRNFNSAHRQKSDSQSDKTEPSRTKQRPVKKDAVLSKSSFTKEKNKQISTLKKDKPSKVKKKKRKIVSDTSSDDDDEDENQNKQDDGDDDDYDIRDMLEDEDDGEDDDDDSDHSESWELPDGVQYYDNLCSARKCLNPVGKQVDWVMCDTCEQWYHVVCVDCPIDVVLNEDVQFHCGFC